MENMFTTIMTLLQKGVTAAGAILVIWGAVSVGRGLKDNNGPGIQNGVMEIVGGGIIVAAALYFGNITL